MTYRNSEGYSDPSAGKALANIARDSRREQRKFERKQAKENYELLCRQFKRAAEEYGFEFPGQIWLRDIKSGFIYKSNKGGERDEDRKSN